MKVKKLFFFLLHGIPRQTFSVIGFFTLSQKY